MALISEEFKNKVGVEWQAGVYDVEKGMIRNFARAIGDPNPLWQEQSPPVFIVTVGGEPFGEMLARAFPEGLLHGSTELESYQPVRPGDTITVMVKVASVRERQKMAFATFELTYRNQKNEVVAMCQQTMIAYAAEGAKNG